MENNRNNNGTTTAPHRLDSIKDSVKGLVDQGHDKVNAIKDKVVDLQHKAKDQGGVALDKVGSLIKAHPFVAIGIAFGVGYLVMRLVRR